MFSDVNALACALLAVPDEARDSLCQQVMREAELSDRYVRRLGRLHPQWGNGTLSAAASRYPRKPARSFDDGEFCRCFALIMEHLCRRPRALHL